MALDVYIVAAKGRHADQAAAGFWGDEAAGHEDRVIAHGGHLNDDEWRDTRTNNVCGKDSPRAYFVAPGAAALLEPVLIGFAGKDPAELQAALPGIWKALSREEQRLAFQPMLDLQLACEHAQKARTHPKHGVLYEDLRVVCVKSE
jgi:hypothetical protein